MGNPQEENPDHKVFQIKCKINSPVAPAAFEESITQPSAHDNSWLLKTEPVTQRREIFLQLPNLRVPWWGSSSDEATSLCKPELTLRKWTSNLCKLELTLRKQTSNLYKVELGLRKWSSNLCKPELTLRKWTSNLCQAFTHCLYLYQTSTLLSTN